MKQGEDDLGVASGVGRVLEDALGGGRVGREEGGELDTAARGSFRRWGCGLGNQCRVVGQ